MSVDRTNPLGLGMSASTEMNARHVLNSMMNRRFERHDRLESIIHSMEKVREKMDRKAFLKKTMQMGMASGSMLLLNADGSFAQQSQQEEKDRVQMFKEDWVTALIENMDTQLDEKTRTDLMLACGRRCARRGAIGLAQRCKGDLKKMVDTLDQYPPIEATFEGDDTI